MSFNTFAENIRLDDGHILRAGLLNADGNVNQAEVDLNQFLGNNNGAFEWSGENFSGSAQNISFSIEGDNVPVLRAELADADGNFHGADINLAERIGNDNGNFVFN
ncbi:Cyanovirin-N [Podospora didyma]|uniref:Cyanovirin-N n=1 Tax=Podospora didyma TaxID=330526 RepID=A0AAE0N2K5_9PEZI|nr:Cyanovirin-N [Podospora didyma]